MSYKSALKDLIELSSYAGKHPEFVQGGGGNCSVKYSDNLMIIKASGLFLEEVNSKSGYVITNKYDDRILTNKEIKPSLETSIHKLLGNYVIHTHPILVGGIVCSYQGKQIFKTLFSDKFYIWIDYISPGINLSNKIKSKIKNYDIRKKIIFFVQNHGVFVSAGSKSECIKAHDFIVKRLTTFFYTKECNLRKKYVKPNAYLTPDHVVYLSMNKKKCSDKQRLSINELCSYTNEVIALIKDKGWKVKYLSKEDVEFIKTMKEEKYRQKIIR